MNKENLSKLTFALLDKAKGLSELPPANEEEYPLPAWYRSVCKLPLTDLGIEDVCKACRQQIHLEYIVPMALQHLHDDSLAGEMYDGELIASLKFIPSNYWLNHVDEAVILKSIVDAILQHEEITDDVRKNMQELQITLATRVVR